MKTIARVYDTYGQARQVVADLEASGVAASDINLIANKYVCDESARIQEPSAAGPGAGVGAALGGTAGLLAGLGIIAIPGLGPVVAAGALAATAVGAVAGAATGGSHDSNGCGCRVPAKGGAEGSAAGAAVGGMAILTLARRRRGRRP